MQIWTVANQKGGVGKTTTAVSLAGVLARRGQRVLLVDMDPQGSLTSYFGLEPGNTGSNSLYELFSASAEGRVVVLAGLLRPTAVAGLSLLPASTALATLDRKLGAREGMGLVVQRGIQGAAAQFDTVILDCPPTLGVLMVNALAASDRLIIPAQTEFLAIKGLERMLHTLAMVARNREKALVTTIVPTLFDQRTRASHESLKTMQDSWPGLIWRAVIPVDTQFREASKRGLPLTVLDPRSRGAVAYEALADDLLADAGATHPEPVVS
jgi:chromosome partitioning protein